MATKDSEWIVTTALKQALLARGESTGAIAAAAEVSTRILASVRNGWPNPRDWSERQRRAVARSIARLSLYLDLSPETALRDLGLSGMQSVSAAVEGVHRRAARRPALDPTLGAIASTRRDQGDAGVVHVGIVDPAQKEEADTPLEAFGHAYCRALFRAAGIDARLVFDSLPNTAAAIDALRHDASPGTCAAVFGLADLPSRRHQGLSFVPIPGLNLAVGAIFNAPLTNGDGAPNYALTWPDLLDLDHARTPRPVVLVLKGEVGHELMKTELGYREGKDIEVYSGPVQPASLVPKVRQFLDGHSGIRTPVFVADAVRCRGVLNILDGHTGHPGAFAHTTLSYDSEWTPWFDLNIALREDSPKFEALLAAATDNLFGHGVMQTARLYVDLFDRMGEERPRIRQSGWRSLGSSRLKRFQAAVATMIRRKSKLLFQPDPDPATYSPTDKERAMMPGLFETGAPPSLDLET